MAERGKYEVQRIIYGARIVRIGEKDAFGFEHPTASWWYEDNEAAVAALQEMIDHGLPEPEGWFRAVHDGRRRPDGDASREYVSY